MPPDRRKIARPNQVEPVKWPVGAVARDRRNIVSVDDHRFALSGPYLIVRVPDRTVRQIASSPADRLAPHTQGLDRQQSRVWGWGEKEALAVQFPSWPPW